MASLPLPGSSWVWQGAEGICPKDIRHIWQQGSYVHLSLEGNTDTVLPVFENLAHGRFENLSFLLSRRFFSLNRHYALRDLLILLFAQ